MIDEHRSTEVMIEELDDDDDVIDGHSTDILDYLLPPIPTLGPAVCHARAQRRRCVRRQHRRSTTQRSRRRRRGGHMTTGMLLVCAALCFGLLAQLI